MKYITICLILGACIFILGADARCKALGDKKGIEVKLDVLKAQCIYLG